MNKEQWAKYPKDWKEISKRLRDEIGFCEQCGLPPQPRNPLTVHHKDYNPSHNSEDNLVVLCAKCHLKTQAIDKKLGRDTRKYQGSLFNLCLLMSLKYFIQVVIYLAI